MMTKQKMSLKTGVNDMYLIIGMIIVGVPIVIMGCVAAWREYRTRL